MNKKAVVFSWALVMFSIIVLVYALVTFNSKYMKYEISPVGEKQYDLIKIYQENDKTLFFIDKSADYAVSKTIYELAEKGFEIKDFGTIFNNNLNEYLKLYTEYNLPQDNYDTAIITEAGKTEILGFAVNNIEVEQKKNYEGEIVVEETKEISTDMDKVAVDEKKYLKTKERIEDNNYNPIIEKYSSLNNIDPDLVRATITHESVGDKDALSSSNAHGLMQIIPKWHITTCKKYCDVNNDNELFDPEKNICCGTKILKDYYNSKRKIEWDCCDDNVCVKTDYSGWSLAIRRYNAAKCVKGADADYVETVQGYYELWAGTQFPLPSKTVKKITKNKILTYSIKPNFKVNLDFDLDIFNKVKEQSEQLIDKCSKEASPESCIDGNLIIFNKNSTFKWSKASNTDRTFNFNVNTNKLLFPFEDEVIIKFSLNFPEP